MGKSYYESSLPGWGSIPTWGKSAAEQRVALSNIILGKGIGDAHKGGWGGTGHFLGAWERKECKDGGGGGKFSWTSHDRWVEKV